MYLKIETFWPIKRLTIIYFECACMYECMNEHMCVGLLILVYKKKKFKCLKLILWRDIFILVCYFK